MRSAPKNSNLFLSVEPQVAKISLSEIPLENNHFLNALTGITSFPLGKCDELESNKIKWVIQGGESGQKKRHFELVWANILRRECAENKVAYFFKQIDKVRQIPPDLLIQERPF